MRRGKFLKWGGKTGNESAESGIRLHLVSAFMNINMNMNMNININMKAEVMHVSEAKKNLNVLFLKRAFLFVK